MIDEKKQKILQRSKWLADNGLKSHHEHLSQTGWVTTRVYLCGTVEQFDSYTKQMMIPH